MIEDRQLLDYYLSLRENEAHRWNLSPQSLYIELETRDFLKRHYELKSGLNVCNVGVGVGEWDDFLGYWLEESYGQLTSVEQDEAISARLLIRQQREGHSNRANVVCGDFLHCALPAGHYDLLTMIGSTIHEIGDAFAALKRSHEVLGADGVLFLMNFEKYGRKQDLLQLLEKIGFVAYVIESYNRFSNVSFYCILARKTEATTINRNLKENNDDIHYTLQQRNARSLGGHLGEGGTPDASFPG